MSRATDGNDMTNDKRDTENADLRRLYDLVSRTHEECVQQYKGIAQDLNEMTKAHVVLSTKMENVEGQLRDIKETVIPIRTSVAVHKKDLQDAERDIQSLFKMVGETRDKIRDSVGGVAGATFWESENFKWLVGGGVALIVIVAIAFGALSPKDVKEVLP